MFLFYIWEEADRKTHINQKIHINRKTDINQKFLPQTNKLRLSSLQTKLSSIPPFYICQSSDQAELLTWAVLLIWKVPTIVAAITHPGRSIAHWCVFTLLEGGTFDSQSEKAAAVSGGYKMEKTICAMVLDACNSSTSIWIQLTNLQNPIQPQFCQIPWW